jgi:hypothetical protein
MRKLLLIACAILIGVSLVGIQRAEAATAISLFADGHLAAWVQVDYTETPDGSGYFYYDYTAYLKNPDGSHVLPSGYSYFSDLQALKVMNPSKNPVVLVASPASPTWNFSQGLISQYYQWVAINSSNHLLINNQLDSMKVKSKFQPTVTTGYVWDGGPTVGGKTVAPAPEPASLSLLGLSLLGLGSVMFRKKFKT